MSVIYHKPSHLYLLDVNLPLQVILNLSNSSLACVSLSKLTKLVVTI